MSKTERKPRKKPYRTPKGKDEREVSLPNGFEGLKGQGYKAIKYGHTLQLVGPGLSTKIMDEIRQKIKVNESVVICCTGPPGKGKTYLGTRWGQKIDKNFHVNDTPPPSDNEDDGQVTFSREHIAYLTGENTPLVRGQVILTDESHWGIGARSWQDKDQQEIVNYLAAIRSKGFILIIVVLHTRMIDTLLRDFVLNYEFHVTRRGYATVYRRWFPMGATEPYKKRMGRLKLKLPDEEICNYPSCLQGRRGCRWLHPKKMEDRCMTIRAIYERRKDWFLNEKGRKSEENGANKPYTPYEEIEAYAQKQIDHIPKTQEDIILWMKESGFNIKYADRGPYAKRIKALKATHS